MPPLQIVGLALLSAIFFAATNVWTRLGLMDASVRQSLVFTYGATVILVAVLAAIFAQPLEIESRALVLFVLDGILNFGAVIFLFLSILKLGPSTASAIKNTSPLPAILLSTLLLRESVQPLVYLGAFVTVGGALLLSLEPGKGAAPLRRDILYPVVGAFLFAADNVLRRGALSSVHSPLLGAVVAMPVSLVLAIGWSGRARDRLAPLRAIRWFALAGIAQGLGVTCLYLALSSGLVAVVLPISNTTPIFVLLASAFLVRRVEVLSWRIVAGVLIVVLGVALISLAR